MFLLFGKTAADDGAVVKVIRRDAEGRILEFDRRFRPGVRRQDLFVLGANAVEIHRRLRQLTGDVERLVVVEQVRRDAFRGRFDLPAKLATLVPRLRPGLLAALPRDASEGY